MGRRHIQHYLTPKIESSIPVSDLVLSPYIAMPRDEWPFYYPVEDEYQPVQDDARMVAQVLSINLSGGTRDE